MSQEFKPQDLIIFSFDTLNILKCNVHKLKFAWICAIDKAREVGESTNVCRPKIGNASVLCVPQFSF